MSDIKVGDIVYYKDFPDHLFKVVKESDLFKAYYVVQDKKRPLYAKRKNEKFLVQRDDSRWVKKE